jgi:ABC-type branched-subunit amino acid transport system substrate-binding protein
MSFAQTAEKIVPDSMADKIKKPNAAFDASKMSDMSDFDPATWVSPKGDTIKVAVVAAFSGPGATHGNYYYTCMAWAAHDINKRGGIWVDGKKKLVEVIKADHMGRNDQAKKICERMALREKVHVFWGTNGSQWTQIMNEVATKYKLISMNIISLSDELQDAHNFSRYCFQPSYSAEQVGLGWGYYYGKIRKKETKFYIMCQDYSYGHDMGKGFKKGLKEYYPEAVVVGEDYHKLFLTDYAPYIEKIKASGAEVIFTGNWTPDATNLLKQARQMGLNIPIANNYMDDANMLHEVGMEWTKGLVNINTYLTSNPQFKTPGHIKIHKAWHDQWKKWKTPPFNSPSYMYHYAQMGTWVQNSYWLLSVIERAKSTNPEKIIEVWENDTYQSVNGKIFMMRACDHKMIQDLTVGEYVPPEKQRESFNIPPYYWYDKTCGVGPTYLIPAGKILPWMDQNLDRCKGKNGWGE